MFTPDLRKLGKETEAPQLMAFPLFGLIPGRMNPINGQQEMMATVQGGMTLRDYFAGQALINRFPDGCSISKNDRRIYEAYDIADQMIKVREGRQNEN